MAAMQKSQQQVPQQSMAMSQGNHEWGSSFWDCCSPIDTCCWATWCPCVLYGKTKARRNDPSHANYSAINSDCLAWCGLLCFGVQSVLQCVNRTNMRDQLHINGNTFGDFCGAVWCPSCGLVQEEKETLLVNGQANGSTQGYQAQAGGMEYKN